MDKARITYPCVWEYTIIGRDEDALRKLVFDVMPREYEISFGRHSSKGHFVSLYVKIEVQSEAERNDIFARLQADENTKMIL